MKRQIVASVCAIALTTSALESFASDDANKQGARVHLTPTSVSSAAVYMADPIELESHRGGLAPLAFALGIASFDLALMGMYWGVYVPMYATKEPAFVAMP